MAPRSGQLGRSALGDLQLGTPPGEGAAPTLGVSGQLGNPHSALGRFQLGTPPTTVAAPRPPTITCVGQVVAPAGYATCRAEEFGPLPTVQPVYVPQGGVQIGPPAGRPEPAPLHVRVRVVAPLAQVRAFATCSPPPPITCHGTVVAPPGTATGTVSSGPASVGRARVVAPPAGGARGHGRSRVPHRGNAGVRSPMGGAAGAAAVEIPYRATGGAAAPRAVARGTARMRPGPEHEELWLLGLGELAEFEELVLA